MISEIGVLVGGGPKFQIHNNLSEVFKLTVFNKESMPK